LLFLEPGKNLLKEANEESKAKCKGLIVFVVRKRCEILAEELGSSTGE